MRSVRGSKRAAWAGHGGGKRQKQSVPSFPSFSLKYVLALSLRAQLSPRALGATSVAATVVSGVSTRTFSPWLGVLDVFK